MVKYRFIKFEHGEKWYAQSPRGALAGLKRQHAELFTEDDWLEWGEAGGWEAEPVGEEQMMRAAGARPLPGFED